MNKVVVETGRDIPKQSVVMNEQNEDLKTINQTFEASRDWETETLLPNKEAQKATMMMVLIHATQTTKVTLYFIQQTIQL